MTLVVSFPFGDGSCGGDSVVVDVVVEDGGEGGGCYGGTPAVIDGLMVGQMGMWNNK